MSTHATPTIDETIDRLEAAQAHGTTDELHAAYDQAVDVLAAHLEPGGGA